MNIKAVFLLAMVPVAVNAVDFGWDIPADTTFVDGYEVHCGLTGGGVTDINVFPGALTSTGSVDLDAGTWDCFAKSYNVTGKSTGSTNTVSVTVEVAPTITRFDCSPSGAAFDCTLEWQ